MRNETLKIVTCFETNLGFRFGEHYYMLEKDRNGIGTFVNKQGLLESAPVRTMKIDKVLSELFPVVYIGNNPEFAPLLVENEVYSVFKVSAVDNVAYYTIFGQSYKMEEYPAELFLNYNVYNELMEQGTLEGTIKQRRADFSNKLEEIKKAKEKEKEIARYKAEKQEAEEEKARQAKREAEIEEKRVRLNRNFVEDVIEAIRTDDLDRRIIINSDVSKSAVVTKVGMDKWYNALISGIIALYAVSLISAYTSSILATVISIIPMAILEGLILNIDKLRPKVKDISPNVGYFTTINQLPDSLLVKLKKAEIQIALLEARKIVGIDVINLIREPICLAVGLCDAKSEEVKQEVNEFLDTVIEYITSINETKKVEEGYIERKIAENLSDTIMRNKNMFKSMVNDNDRLNELFKL